MRFIPNFEFNQLSFWLGFLAASLFWWFFSKIKYIFPRIKSIAIQQWTSFQKRRSSAAEIFIKSKVFQKAQSLHLANELFPLEDILIEPKLIAPPIPANPADTNSHKKITDQLIPYFPDLPELSAQYNVTKLNPFEALENGSNIILIGESGVGKTTTLAYMASILANGDSRAGKFLEYLPIFIHAQDLELSEHSANSPENQLIQILSEKANPFVSKRIPRVIKQNLENGNCLLLLDGLDELRPEKLKRAEHFLSHLQENYPKLQFVTTGNPHYLNNLLNLNTYPISISAWNKQDRIKFISRWIRQWNQKITPNIATKTDETRLNTSLLENWFQHENSYLNPLEWTLKIWADLAGDVQGPTVYDSINAYLTRISDNKVPLENLSSLALEFVQKQKTVFNYKELSKALSRSGSILTLIQSETPDDNSEKESSSKLPRRKSKQKRKKISSLDQAILTLLDSGLLVEYYKEQFGFCNPFFTGYLASLQLDDIDTTQPSQTQWSVMTETLKGLVSQNKAYNWINSVLDNDQQPLFSDLILICRSLKNAPANLAWRSKVMMKLVDMLHSNYLSIGSLMRLTTAFILTNDPSISILFQKLLSSEKSEVRFLSAIGCGALCDPKSVNMLKKYLSDPVTDVQIAACMALHATGTSSGFQSILDVFVDGSEDVQQAAAEILASIPGEGYEALKEAISTDNLMIRRAAVMGLSQVHEPWAKELLEKIAIEDNQWVVRNAAGQAVDMLNHIDQHIPAPLVRPSENAWLIAYAGELGVGISPGEEAIELLQSALKSGSTIEKIAALDYLRLDTDQNTINSIKNAVLNQNDQINNASLTALWYIAVSDPS